MLMEVYTLYKFASLILKTTHEFAMIMVPTCRPVDLGTRRQSPPWGHAASRWAGPQQQPSTQAQRGAGYRVLVSHSYVPCGEGILLTP